MTAEILDLADGNLNLYSETTTEGEKGTPVAFHGRFSSTALLITFLEPLS